MREGETRVLTYQEAVYCPVWEGDRTAIRREAAVELANLLRDGQVYVVQQEETEEACNLFGRREQPEPAIKATVTCISKGGGEKRWKIVPVE